MWRAWLNARSEGNSIIRELNRRESHQAKGELSETKWSPVTFMAIAIQHDRPGRNQITLRNHYWIADEHLALTFHHLQAGIKLMAARHAPDAIGFNDRFIIPDTHTATVRTSRQMQYFVLNVFIAGAT